MPRTYGYLPSLPTYFRLGLPLFTNKPQAPFPATSLFSTHTLRNKRALKPREDPITCPIHALDDDVLFLIFCTFPAKTMQALHDVLTLTHVCRRWRQLCVHCPELWRNYALVPPRVLGGKEQIEFNRELLKRTGRAGLIGGWENEEWVGMTPRTPLLLRSLTNYTHHLHSLCIQLREGDSGALRVFREYPFPRLRSLSLLQSDPQHKPILLLDHPTFREDLSSLNRLVLRGVWLDIRKLKTGVVFDTLVIHVERRTIGYGDVDAQPMSFAQCVNIVDRFPQLRSWELDLFDLRSPRRSGPHLNDEAIPDKITLNKLTTLDLRLCHVEDLEYLVKSVSLPLCRRLHVDILGAEGADEQRRLTEAFIHNHTDHLLPIYSELTVYNAGGSGFGFALSRDARVRAGEGLLSKVDPAVLALKAADISLVFSQDRSECVPEEYTAFLDPLKAIARAVPTIIIFDGGGCSQTTTGGFKMQDVDYASTRELIHLGYTEGSVRNLVGYRELLQDILRSKPRAAMEGRQVIWKCASPAFWDLRLIPVMLP